MTEWIKLFGNTSLSHGHEFFLKEKKVNIKRGKENVKSVPFHATHDQSTKESLSNAMRYFPQIRTNKIP
jgi:hypothetical protein